MSLSKKQLEKKILSVLEFSSSFCMDVEAERNALADALAVELAPHMEPVPQSIIDMATGIDTQKELEELAQKERAPREQLIIDTIEDIAGTFAGDIVRHLYDDNLVTLAVQEVEPFARKHGYEFEHVFMVLELLVGAHLWKRVVLSKSKQRLMMARVCKRLGQARTRKDWRATASAVRLGWTGE